jgi:hypothetical protein
VGLDGYVLDDAQLVCVEVRMPESLDPAVMPPGELDAIVARCREIADPVVALGDAIEAAYGEAVESERLACVTEGAADLPLAEQHQAIVATEPATGEPDGGAAAVLAGLFLECGGLPG